ncbi:hypothetical protein GGI07_005961, partial [Coemansia sp. Benny D115]
RLVLAGPPPPHTHGRAAVRMRAPGVLQALYAQDQPAQALAGPCQRPPAHDAVRARGQCVQHCGWLLRLGGVVGGGIACAVAGYAQPEPHAQPDQHCVYFRGAAVRRFECLPVLPERALPRPAAPAAVLAAVLAAAGVAQAPGCSARWLWLWLCYARRASVARWLQRTVDCLQQPVDVRRARRDAAAHQLAAPL